MPKPYTPNDKLSQKAKAEGYRARSIYKLKELDEKFKLLKSGMTVLDLGAAPGSWLQYAIERVGPKGIVIGIDLQEIEPIEGVDTFKEDITKIEEINKILNSQQRFENRCPRADIILSDLAPSTSGIKDVDQWKSIELSQAVVKIAKDHLKPGGTCVMKVLRGADFDEFLKELKKEWKNVKTAQVKASRDRSKEIYILLNG
ncbi:RlmE family RNA methyltransferase [Patescibacteria group bacterium]|nr:RlmE family RNA methyltransferase [Patescibacteria group bacterium]MBU1122971.1 RlmE family RNA methyltransferase [Patescibacteria group bacterium]MBU1911178.1 RlmE family RNA methyltransferase [Patescibacteria group bacterium]